ncbi:hypothetical protein Ocin01_16775 [Orchesella cincta]|uniref:Uncharacterized protein n=1 Tax=Orchesella cincta TaxID=48709 RepID=A0A1D2MA86_ORCCI|nr:hypothetical protein Ocin01_16775 [Orchesella cincta]
MRTAPGTSRGVPSKRALMLLQTWVHLKNTGVNVENSMVLNTDLRVNHFAVATDLTGSSLSDEQDLDSAHSLRTAFIPKEISYERSMHMATYILLNFIENIKERSPKS